MSLGIKCMVEECAYNKDHVCTADSIEVASSMSNLESAVTSSENTACMTFKPKQKV
jgi:hypothetical protein